MPTKSAAVARLYQAAWLFRRDTALSLVPGSTWNVQIVRRPACW